MQNNIIKKILTENKNFFIIGKAGTGKSTLTKLLIRELKNKNFAVLAPSGIAAINIEGETVHKFFGFGIDINLQKLKNDKEKKIDDENSNKYKFLEYVIIDEISMLRADLIDAIDISLRVFKQNSLPFGGVKMIFVGDLYQLPPIVTQNDEKNDFTKKYSNPYFFNADVFSREKINLELIELTKVYRQQDQKFIKILNNIRIGEVKNEDLDFLNQACEHNITDKHIFIGTTNKNVDEINKNKLRKLSGKEYVFNLEIKGNITYDDIKNSIFLDMLVLKEQARVMFLQNSANGDYVNGTLGIITEINNSGITIKKDDGEKITLTKNSGKQDFIEHIYNHKTKKIEQKIRGTIIQYPLKLAWAVTVHKSQGMTYEEASLDLSYVFADGQTYVALSRVKSFEGLHLNQKIEKDKILTDQKIKKFLKTKFKNNNLIDLTKEGLDVPDYQKEIFFGDKGGINYFNVAKSIIKKINLQGAKAYIVGGFCRNRYLGLESETDIDISTDILPENLKKIFNIVDVKGERFGVLTIKEQGFVYEITTFRDDENYRNIKFSKKFSDDANRRDFTINSIYLDPIKNEYKTFHHKYGEMTYFDLNKKWFFQDAFSDLDNKIIRFINNPKDRIEEDPLRVLRYIRFKYSLGLKDCCDEQYLIVKQNFHLLKKVPFERIKVELEKIFISKNSYKAIDELKKLGFFKLFIKEVDDLSDIPGGEPYHLEGNVWKHIILIFKYLEEKNFTNPDLFWLALLHDTGKKETFKKEGNKVSYIGHEELSAKIFEKIAGSLKFTNNQKKEIGRIIENHLLFGKILEIRKTKRYKLYLHPFWQNFFDFCSADFMGKIPNDEKYLEEIKKDYDRFIKNYELRKNEIYTGNDILKKYPDLKGKEIGERLESLNNQILAEL